MNDPTEQELYLLGLGVAATAAEAYARGIEITASVRPPSAAGALREFAKILRQMADAQRRKGIAR